MGGSTRCEGKWNPDKETCCGLSGLLSLMERLALSEPKDVGAKVTEIVHDLPAATLAPQLFVCEKSLGSLPVIVMLAMLRLVAAALIKVVTSVSPVWLIGRKPKSRLSGTIFTLPNVRFIVAVADLVGSVTEVAVSLTEVAADTVAGAL